jgi:hypothetical protein
MVRIGKVMPTHRTNVRLAALREPRKSCGSAIQVLLCQDTGSAEDHVCAAPVPGRVSRAHSFEGLHRPGRARMQRQRS